MPADDPMARHLRMMSTISTALATIVDEFAVGPTVFQPECSDPVAPTWLAWAKPIIAEVLADHHPTTSTHSRNPDQSRRVLCNHEDDTVKADFPDEQGWREHVAHVIAARIGRHQDQAVLALMHYRNDRLKS